MAKLKKFDDYMNEQDQHRVESEKDTVIQNQINDVTSDEVDTDISSVDLSGNEIDQLRNANDVHEDVDNDSEDTVNEGAVKNLLGDITEELEKMVKDIEVGGFKLGDVQPYAERILSICSGATNESESKSKSNFDPTKPTFKFSINVGGLSKQRAEQQIAQLMEDYSDPNYNMFIIPIKEGNSDVECIHNESLTEQEDIPQIILDQEEARRFKETKDTLDGKSKEVFDTTADVEKSLEKGNPEEEAQEPYKESDETTPELDIVDYVQTDENFTVYPNGEDFKLLKRSLGDDVNYQQLKEHLKVNFPGWENHTSSILDVWSLIDLK
ncbi:MAG: hypothetical protein SLAVMIC_00763 [uncultured marine phage]|uniref:Uncharacterized protein n=1 Tax=uncultured marine phage TaxID=707152 RepID=A0A8D9FQH8_9VIRU|nr:MAG: hypothetical protein SLAVMIC_00763 [uncultured marine phage]